MALHTINKSPQHAQLLSTCLRTLTAGDALLLLQDAVYAGIDSGGNAALFADLPVDVKLYVLHEDLLARGLEEKLLPHWERVDYAGFVELACQHPKTISWY